MSLTWRDLVATVLVGFSALLAYARVRGFDWPLVTSWRLSTLTLFAIGLTTCIVVGSGADLTRSSWTISASVLGGVAFLAALVGVASGSKIAFIVLAVSIIILWVTTTIRRIISRGA